MNNIRKLLPATSTELAAELGTTVRLINASLQDLKRKGRAAHGLETVPPLEKRRGRAPFIWYRT